MRVIKLRANLMLLLAALIWGTTFVAQKSAMEHLGPFVFNGVRCLVGAFALFVISMFIKSRHKLKRKKLIEGGAVLGTILFLATSLQQMGIVDTTAGKAGFISSLYIIIVPFFSLIAGKKIGKAVWAGALLALLGLYLLSAAGSVQEINKGDLTVLFSAVFFALHIIAASKYSKKVNPIKLSCAQFVFAGLFALILGLFSEGFDANSVLACKNEIFFTGVLSCAIAFTLQIGAQRHVQSYIACLIMSLESVFAIAAGFLFLNETLNLNEILGCMLMLSGILIAQYKKKAV